MRKILIQNHALTSLSQHDMA